MPYKVDDLHAGNSYFDNVYIGGSTSRGLRAVSGEYGTVQTTGGGAGNWEGYSIDGRYVFMSDGANYSGLYNDVDNEWHILCYRNQWVQLYYNNQVKLETNNGGVTVTGTVTATTFSGTATTADRTTGNGKIVVQNSNDGGNARGIWMWNSGDSNWGIYMASSGSGKSISGGNAVQGDGFTSHAIRFRVANNSNNGWIWENSSNLRKMSLRADDGFLSHSGNMYNSGSLETDGAFYYKEWIRNNGTSTSGLYWHNSSNPGYAWHIYPESQQDMTFRTGSSNGGIKGTVSDATARGYIHWTTGNEIGFLNSSRQWSLRMDNSKNCQIYGSLSATSGSFSGSLSIGVSGAPIAPLQVNSQMSVYLSARYYNSAGQTAYTSTTRAMSIYAQHHIACVELQVFSDRRIKKNIVDADDAECLEVLRLLK